MRTKNNLSRVGKVKEKKVHSIFICHYCGMHGHIRPYSYKLHGRVSQRDGRNFNISWGKRHFIGCNEVKGHIRPRYFDLLETKREQRFCLSRPRNRKLDTKSRRVSIEGKGNHNVKTLPKNYNSHNFVHTKAVWMRKIDLC